MSLNVFVRGYLVFSALCISALIVVGVILYIRINNAVQQNHDTAVATCQAANLSRQQDIAIWNRLLTVSPQPPKGSAAAAEIHDLQVLVALKDTPRVCG